MECPICGAELDYVDFSGVSQHIKMEKFVVKFINVQKDLSAMEVVIQNCSMYQVATICIVIQMKYMKDIHAKKVLDYETIQ